MDSPKKTKVKRNHRQIEKKKEKTMRSYVAIVIHTQKQKGKILINFCYIKH